MVVFLKFFILKGEVRKVFLHMDLRRCLGRKCFVPFWFAYFDGTVAANTRHKK
jgi:hypothetical protein